MPRKPPNLTEPLFGGEPPGEPAANAPLAARMRPRTLDESVGQGTRVGDGRLNRALTQGDSQLPRPL